MRALLFALGALFLAGLWLGPLPALSETAFAAHMAMHMGVVSIAAPLLALGLAGGPFDPVVRFPRLFEPLTASLVELVAVWSWHAPLPFRLARCGPIGLAGEQATFLLAGLLLWLAVLGGGVEQRSNRAATGVLAILLTSMHMTLLGALLALSPRPLYENGMPDRPASIAPSFWDAICRSPALPPPTRLLTPLQDQHVGGAIMIAVGGVVYLIGGLSLTGGLLRDASAPGERR